MVHRLPRDAGRRAAFPRSRRPHRGVSLIELMVGMVIGLLAVLVITQVLLTFEGQRRTTSSGADAQLTGNLALYTLKREIEMAGYGLATSRTGLGCAIRNLTLVPAETRPLVPVVITDGGGSGVPDTLRVLSVITPTFSVPTMVTSNHPVAGVGSTEFAVNNTVGIKHTTATEAGDLMIAVPPTPSATDTCTAFRANGTPSTPGKAVAHAADAADTSSGAWNATMLARFPVAGYAAGSYLVNLGRGLIDRTYTVTSGALAVTEYDTSARANKAAVEGFPQVLNLQAFYGLDTNNDGTIDQYTTVTPTTQAGWVQVIAVRVAIVVRSDQPESADVTDAEPVWSLGSGVPVNGVSDSCGSNCVTMTVSTGQSDWKRYRYRLYDTVIPLRNILWRT